MHPDGAIYNTMASTKSSYILCFLSSEQVIRMHKLFLCQSLLATDIFQGHPYVTFTFLKKYPRMHKWNR